MEQELTRATVDPKYTWDVTRMYPSDAAWEEAFAEAKADCEAFAAYAGTLTRGRQHVHTVLDAYMAASERLSLLYTYAMLRRDEDSTQGKYQAMSSRAETLVHAFGAASAFLTPELLALPSGELEAMIADPSFADEDTFLKGMLRLKPHTLNPQEEQLLAMAREVAAAPENAYEMLVYADLDLGKTRGEDGKKTVLTDARLHALLTSRDRVVRRSAYQNMMKGYARMGNTLAALYNGQVKADLFEAKARHYESARALALVPDEIDESVYDSLIEAVHGGIQTLNAYLQIKKEELGLAQLHLYDLYAEQETDFEIRLDIDEAFAVFLEAVAPLGEDYVRDAEHALRERWIDVYETKNKRSGAYSCGNVRTCPPYVLLNHTKTYDGLSTLCHEMGHAMHSFYSNQAQPYAKADYTIFVAEVASTCNEILLSEYLRKRYADDIQAQIALIGSLLEHFRTTVFRQTMFAEFEQRAHSMAQAGESLTKESLCAMYLELNKTYYGGACVVDKDVQNEWMRIPHFYSPFYVYKYATGFCAAAALARGILSGDAQKVQAYRRMLTLGGSLPPLEELKIAGVDMSSPEPVCQALDYFAELLLDYGQLLEARRQSI